LVTNCIGRPKLAANIRIDLYSEVKGTKYIEFYYNG